MMNKMRMRTLGKRFQQAMNDRSSTTNLDLISSDEDENGLLKPSRRPINEHSKMTTDFQGHPMRYEKPTLPKVKLHEPKIRVSEAKKIEDKTTHLDSISQLNAIA